MAIAAIRFPVIVKEIPWIPLHDDERVIALLSFQVERFDIDFPAPDEPGKTYIKPWVVGLR